MRLFVAIDFEEKQKNNLVKTQNALAANLVKGRATPFCNMHCTLLFLGETPVERVDEICSLLTQVAQKHSPFATSFCDLAQFDNGCTVAKLKTSNAFASLQRDVAEALAFVKSKNRFLPHVTLFRDAIWSMPFAEVKKTVHILNAPFEAKSFVLFDSTRGEKGMIYTPLTTFDLKE